MKRAVVVVGVLAVVAAGGTYFTLTHYLASVNAAKNAILRAPAPVAPTLGVLVASGPIPVGKVLADADVSWQDWPKSVANQAAASGAITSPKDGEAAKGKMFDNAIAKSPMFKGQPITEDEVVRPGTGSILPVVLAPGYRTVTIPVDSIMGVGGMVQPGDHVDILLTMNLAIPQSGVFDPTTGTETPRIVTETIMKNVKVLTADRRFAVNTDAATPAPGTVTLEVTPEQAEQLVTASQMGHFTLTMRPFADGPALPRTGLPYTTDDAVMLNFRAGFRHTSANKLNPLENPFPMPLDLIPPPPKKIAAKVAPAPQPSTITVYRFTAPTVVTLGTNGTIADQPPPNMPKEPPPPPPEPVVTKPVAPAPSAPAPVVKPNLGVYTGGLLSNKAR